MVKVLLKDTDSCQVLATSRDYDVCIFLTGLHELFVHGLNGLRVPDQDGLDAAGTLHHVSSDPSHEPLVGIGVDKDQTTTAKIPTNKTTSATTTSSSTPLSFKGIPMTGSLSSFGRELVKAGFRNNGDGTYTGDFAGYSGCRITPSGSNPVEAVRVDFPVISDWDELEKSYDSLQASLTRKYGKEPKTATNSNLAVYELPDGTISLDADVRDRSSWHVILTYANNPSVTTSSTSGRNPIDDL